MRLPATEVAAESEKAVLAKSGCLQEVSSQCGPFIPSTLCTTPTGRRCTSRTESRPRSTTRCISRAYFIRLSAGEVC